MAHRSRAPARRFSCERDTMRIFGFAGFSGSGKTTLIEKLIPVLTARGLRTSVIKHAHHGFDVDRPGKDSYRHREAGCSEVLVSSSKRWALMHELWGAPEPRLDELVAKLSPCPTTRTSSRSRPIPHWRRAFRSLDLTTLSALPSSSWLVAHAFRSTGRASSTPPALRPERRGAERARTFAPSA